MRKRVTGELRQVFRPEFMNRLDDIVVFHRLERSHIRAIVEVRLADFEKRLGAQRITLTVTDQAKKALGDEGYDPVYGARPLKRVISRQLENPVSRMIISGEISEGQHLQVDYDPEQMKFRFHTTE